MDMKQTDSGAPLTARDEEIIHAASPRDPHILKGVKSTERVIDLSMHTPEVAARRGLPAAILAVKNHTGAAWASMDMASTPKAEARIYASSSRPRDAWVVRLPRPLTDAEGDAIYDWMNGKEDAERDSVRANQAQSNAAAYPEVLPSAGCLTGTAGCLTGTAGYRMGLGGEFIRTLTAADMYLGAPRDPNQAMIDRDGPAKAPAALPSQPGPAPAKPTPPLPVADITRTGTHFGRWGAGL